MVQMPEPFQDYTPSLTMRYALAGNDPTTPPRLTLPVPPLPPRSHSDPGHLDKNKPKFGLDDFQDMPAPATPTRILRSASSPTTPVATSASFLTANGGTSKYQCSGITSKGVRCKRIVKNLKNPIALTVVMPDAEVEVYCVQHEKSILSNKHMRVAGDGGEKLIDFSGMSRSLGLWSLC
jgi:hypothetical protein